jgi:hypothetical protein
MTCSFPPPVTEDELSLALEGFIEPHLAEHFARCPGCRRRLEEARAVEQRMGMALFRWDCPPSARLGDYHTGLLPDDEASAITRHVEGCSRCLAELAALRVFLATDDAEKAAPPPDPDARPSLARSVGRRLREAVAQLVPNTTQPALRGQGAEPVVLQTATTTIFLEMRRDVSGYALVGQLVPQDLDTWIGSLVEVHHSGAIQSTATVDDMGGFRCDLASNQPVSLRIVSPGGRSIALFDVSIEAS